MTRELPLASDFLEDEARGIHPADEDDLGPVANPESVARTICLRLLDAKARSRAELFAAMRKKNVPVEIAERLLNRYTEVGLIDDQSLADGYALAQHRERGLARAAVAQKLRHRGLDDEIIADALEQITPEGERAAARALAERKLRALAGLAPEVQTRRLIGMLARRGYSPGLAYEVAKALISVVAIEESA
ncbi:MAG TPA: regulatory protein RecX [Jatrophihabitans sp.]|jgi:regulatory protein